MTNICLFLPTGKTFTFKGIDNWVDNENMLSFTYIAMSDKTQKLGVFQKSQMVGYATYVTA